jgi:hypothetical protein
MNEKIEALLHYVKSAKDEALALKHDDSLQSTDARRVAVVFTDLEKVEAYIKTFLVEED